MRVFPAIKTMEGFVRTKIIVKREINSTISTWCEYLCLGRGSLKKYKAYAACYEPLAEAANFYDTDKGIYKLPAMIDGKQVKDIEGTWVVGGSLNYYDHEDFTEFDSIDDKKLINWLNFMQWDEQLSAIRQYIKPDDNRMLRNIFGSKKSIGLTETELDTYL